MEISTPCPSRKNTLCRGPRSPYFCSTRDSRSGESLYPKLLNAAANSCPSIEPERSWSKCLKTPCQSLMYRQRPWNSTIAQSAPTKRWGGGWGQIAAVEMNEPLKPMVPLRSVSYNKDEELSGQISDPPPTHRAKVLGYFIRKREVVLTKMFMSILTVSRSNSVGTDIFCVSGPMRALMTQIGLSQDGRTTQRDGSVISKNRSLPLNLSSFLIKQTEKNQPCTHTRSGERGGYDEQDRQMTRGRE